MRLTHVSVWDNGTKKGWRHIECKDACDRFPRTVSAEERIFLCELCGQYVTLTNGKIQERHFRHQPDVSAYCPEKDEGYVYPHVFSYKDISLPIRLKIEGNFFRLQIGFIALPDKVINDNNGTSITIRETGQQILVHRVNFPREATSYKTVDKIRGKYHLDYDKRGTLKRYWPEDVFGIDKGGTLFSSTSKLRIPYDGDIQICKIYYLVTKGSISYMCRGVQINQIVHNPEGYFLYEIQVRKFNKRTAAWCLRYHARLVDVPNDIQVLWPPAVQYQHRILTPSNKIWINCTGQNDSKMQASKPFGADASWQRIYDIQSEQVGSNCIVAVPLHFDWVVFYTGRYSVLRYILISHSTELGEQEQLSFKWNDEVVSAFQEIQTRMPSPEKIEKIWVPYDGYLVCRERGVILGKRILTAETEFFLSDVRFGQVWEIYIGTERIAAYEFIKSAQKKLSNSTLDREMYNYLRQLVKNDTPQGCFSAEAKGIVGKLHPYPKCFAFIRQCYRQQRLSTVVVKQFWCKYRKKF